MLPQSGDAMQPPLALAKQIDILLQFGKARRMVVSYNGISKVTNESVANIRKIHLGENRNPGINTLRNLMTYFCVGMAYLDCRTEQDCWDYLDMKHVMTVVDE